MLLNDKNLNRLKLLDQLETGYFTRREWLVKTKTALKKAEGELQAQQEYVNMMRVSVSQLDATVEFYKTWKEMAKSELFKEEGEHE